MKSAFTKTTPTLNLVGKLSEDSVKLFIDVERVGTNPVMRKDLIDALSEFVKPERIDPGILDDIAVKLNAGEKISERRIAKGKEVGPGINGKVVHLVRLYTGKAHLSQENNPTIDFRDLNLFDNISIGQQVARVYPPRAGEDGEDAFGAVIKAPIGKEVKVNIDRSLALESANQPDVSYQVIVAKQNGYLFDDGGQLKISPELLVKGDVDFHVGNIKFIGKIKVSGDVHQGFKVEGDEGVEIVGGVTGATIISRSGSISVKGMAIGGPNSKMLAGKSIILTRCQELSAEAKEILTIEKESRDSDLRTQNIISAPKAGIFGGKALAVCGVEAKDIGNEGAKKTELHLCADVETGTEYIDLSQNLDKHLKALELLKISLGPFVDNPARISLLKPELKKKMELMLHKFQEVKKSSLHLEEKKVLLLAGARVGTISRVSAHGAIHEGVEIHAGGEVFQVHSTIKGPVTIEFNRDSKAFVQGPLKPAECILDKVKPVAELKPAVEGKK